MPILDVTIVGALEREPGGLAQRLADAAGEVLGTERGRTWVRRHRLADADYAENGGAAPGVRPIFVEVLERAASDVGVRAEIARSLAARFAAVVGRPAENVHVLFAPPAAGRIAFGGALVPPVEPDRASSGAPWEAIVGYSRAVRIGPHVWVTGTVALDEDGAPLGGGDAHTQARHALAFLARVLERVGAAPRHVVRTRIFVTDIERDWQAIGRAHAEVFADVRPATTMVEVRRLIEPWMLVEIEADAHVP